MSRAVKPVKMDSNLYRGLAPNTEDGFGGLVLFCIVSGALLWPPVYLALTASLWFLFMMIPGLWINKTIISFYKNTIPLATYASDRSIYGRAYGQITAIAEPNSYEDAKTLITNIFDHEKSLEQLEKRHDTKWDCEDCWKRMELITKLRENQPIPSVDGSDIERIENKLNERLKIQNDDRKMLSA